MDGVRWLNNPMIGVEENAVTLLWHCAADIAVIDEDDEDEN